LKLVSGAILTIAISASAMISGALLGFRMGTTVSSRLGDTFYSNK
jgi:hypothetical protein